VEDPPDSDTPADTDEAEQQSIVRIQPGTDASQIVHESPAGTTFEFAPGTHRRFAVKPRDGTTFIGLEGAILSGAVPLNDPTAVNGEWRYDGHEFTGTDQGHCVDGYDGCGLTQDIFIDDVMLWQVTDHADLAPGAWYWEGTSIYIADDPTNRRVELSIDARAFVGDADNVTIKNLVIEKYATPAQNGAVQSQVPGGGEHGTGWLIEDVEVRGAHGAGIRTGNDTIVRRAYLHHNGQLGITVSRGVNVLIEDSELAFNNIAGFRWSWEGGGGKFTRTNGLTVRNTYSHDNTGPGLWTDIDAMDTLYDSNRVVNNTGPGIYHEVSYAATIRDNVVEGNGFDFTKWLWGAGILISASTDVEVFGNEVRNNENGITGVQQDRGDGVYGPHLVSELHVYDNTIELGEGGMGLATDTGDKTVFTDRGNWFDRNTYEGATGRSYSWRGKTLDRDGWIAAGQDVNGIWRE
jgi:parallel beta-helix repeat protein